MASLAWRVYYADGSTFSSEDGDWLAAPPRGVLGVVHPEPRVGRAIEHGADGRIHAFYFPSWAEHPWGCDWAGAVDHLIEIGAIDEETLPETISPRVYFDAGIKWGRSVSREVWAREYARMVADPDFPVKAARLPRERP